MSRSYAVIGKSGFTQEKKLHNGSWQPMRPKFRNNSSALRGRHGDHLRLVGDHLR
jgi:hypothetical protein